MERQDYIESERIKNGKERLLWSSNKFEYNNSYKLFIVLNWMVYCAHLNPGALEVYTGPMRSGKTREMVNRIDMATYMDNCHFLLLKPKIDTRDEDMETRFGNLSFPCQLVDEENPEMILEMVEKKHRLIAIDEAHFFSKEILEVIEKLLEEGKNVLAAGLDLDFKGETFGPIGEIMARADEVYKQKAICSYEGCNEMATRTQRLIDGRPALFDSSLILVGNEDKYEPRCLKHHEVPKKRV